MLPTAKFSGTWPLASGMEALATNDGYQSSECDAQQIVDILAKYWATGDQNVLPFSWMGVGGTRLRDKFWSEITWSGLRLINVCINPGSICQDASVCKLGI